MNLEQLTIGQMARLNHISEQTLRLYDKMGLFCPAIINPSNGYRYYSIIQSEKLDLIRYYGRLGFSLKDIQEILLCSDQSRINYELTVRKKALEKEIREIKRNIDSISKTLNDYSYFCTLPKNKSTFVEYLPKTLIIIYDTGSNIYEGDYTHYVYSMCEFRDYLEKINYAPPHFGNIGTIIRHKDLVNSHFDGHELFIYADEHVPVDAATEIIPAGTYLSLCCKNFDNEKYYANQLLHEAKALGMTINGDYYCEVLTESKEDLEYKIRIKIA